MSYKNNINCTEYYNKTINNTFLEIFNKYNSIIIDYLKHCFDNISIQNDDYRKYIICEGISTINHVFKFLLIYTKNIDITYYNCQKAYVYFIEFIDQISEDNHSFLKLNSKDASLFVYKKTIFDINNEIRQNYKSDDNTKSLLEILDPIINIYNYMLFKLVNSNEFNEIIKIANVDFQKIIQKIIKYNIELNNNDFLNKILNFIICYKEKNIIESVDYFIKKIKKSQNYNQLEIVSEYDNRFTI